MRAARLTLALAAAALSLWGLGWCLPARERLERVLPEGGDTPALRAGLERAWAKLHERLGEDILLKPESWGYGFSREAVVDPGWTQVPEVLVSPARSFYLRGGHEDEPNILNAVARLRPTLRGLNPRIYFYGGAYMYALAAWIAAGAALTPARLVSGLGFYMEHPEQMAWLYYLGRTFSAACYLAVGWLVFRTGRRLFGEPAGLAAAALWIAPPGIVILSHAMKPHLMGMFLTLGAYALCAETLRSGETRWGVWAGAAGGLAMAAVSHLGMASLIVALTAALRLAEGRPWRGEAAWVLKAAGLFVLAYLAATPYLLLEPKTTLAAFGEIGKLSHASVGNLWVFAVSGLLRGLTLPVYGLLAAGLVWAAREKDPAARLALGTFFLMFLTETILPHVVQMDSVRYFGALPLGLVLAGAAAARAGKAGLALAGAAALFAAAQSAVLDYNLALDRPGASTRDRAGEWIMANVPAGAEVALLRLPQPSNSAAFRWNRYRLHVYEPPVFAALPASAPLPEWLVLVHPSYDDHAAAGGVLARYGAAAVFEPAGPRFLRCAVGDGYGNPLVEVYRRKT